MDIIALLSFHYLNHNNLNDVITKTKEYKMTNRRFNLSKENDMTIIEDYGHHPTQIKINYETLRTMYPNKKIIAIFKPDRISRIKYFYEDFVNALSLYDKAYVMPFNDKENNYILEKNENHKITFIKNNDLNIIDINKDYIYIIMSSKNIKNIKDYLIKKDC